MSGFILVFLATFWEELGASIGKRKVAEHQESIYTFGFLSVLWSTLFFLIIALVRDGLVFSPASIPTLGARVLLEIVQTHVSILAITRADRSTFGFLRTLTIPLLLAVDIILGYALNGYQVLGVLTVAAALLFLFINHGIKRAGAGLVVFVAVNAVATISLFKYNITHFNSVETEQAIVHFFLLCYFFVMAMRAAKENPIRSLRRPVFFVQSAATGIGSVLISFAYLFGAASIITTMKRVVAIFWSIFSGNAFFKEKNLLIKSISLILIAIGLVLIAP